MWTDYCSFDCSFTCTLMTGYIESEQKNERTVVTSQIYYINHVVYL